MLIYFRSSSNFNSTLLKYNIHRIQPFSLEFKLNCIPFIHNHICNPLVHSLVLWPNWADTCWKHKKISVIPFSVYADGFIFQRRNYQKNTSKHLGYVRLRCGFCNRQFNIFFILIQTHLFHLCKKGTDYDPCSKYPSVM